MFKNRKSWLSAKLYHNALWLPSIIHNLKIRIVVRALKTDHIVCWLTQKRGKEKISLWFFHYLSTTRYSNDETSKRIPVLADVIMIQFFMRICVRFSERMIKNETNSNSNEVFNYFFLEIIIIFKSKKKKKIIFLK